MTLCPPPALLCPIVFPYVDSVSVPPGSASAACAASLGLLTVSINVSFGRNSSDLVPFTAVCGRSTSGHSDRRERVSEGRGLGGVREPCVRGEGTGR